MLQIKTVKFFITVILLLSPGFIFAQQKFTLSGSVYDSKTGEKLIGVTVYERTSERGTVTDVSGHYSLKLPVGNYRISYSFIGYEKFEKRISLKRNLTQSIQLKPTVKNIGEVEVSADAPDHNVRSTEISIEKLDIKEVERIPVIMGETDIMKTIQLLPGITSVAEGESGYIVRGSGFDQNLILMDDMPIYYSSHMQGLFSVFNGDAVDGLTVYKGGTPARFGGRGASVLDVRMRESGFEKYSAGLGIGLITSKFSVEAPLIKDQLSVFVAARSTELGLGYQYDQHMNRNNENAVTGKSSGGKSGNSDYTFFDPYERWNDMNAKVIYKMNNNNRFYFSGYYGRDYAITVGQTNWGNRAASLRWSHNVNSKFTSNTSLIYSQYFTNNESFGGLYVFTSGIKTGSLKQEFSWFPNDKNDVRFGFQSEYQDFNHGDLENTEAGAGKFMPPMQGLESSVYFENDQIINDWLSVHYGLRWSFYQQLGPGDKHVYDPESNESISSENFATYTDVMSAYNSFEPRLNITFLLNENSSVKTSYNRNAQYLRLMSLGGEIQWYDIWMPTTSNIPPMLTDQIAGGYFRNFLNHELKFSAELYYKWMTNAADFEDGLHNYLVDNLEAYVATGKGRAYGLELSLEKPKGKFNGRVSYNLGRSEYQIDVINKGRWYPNMFDKTHSLAVLASYELIQNLTVSSTFLYSTGAPITLPEAYYNVSGVNFPYWEGRNKYRLPDYHRLDLGLKYEPDFLALNVGNHNRQIRTSLEVSLYNIYNRRNIRSVGVTEGGKSGGKNGSNKPETTFQQIGISTYGFMPSFQLNFKF